VNGAPALRTKDGTTIPLSGYPFAAAPASGRDVVLGIRPEQIHFDAEADGASALPLKLTLVEPMGADSLLWGMIGEEQVSVRVGPDETHKTGEKINVHFQPAAASVFDAETGERL
jgi:multiple sugar transport system ATP-binding protein